MSFFGNIGNAIKKGVTDTGHFIGKVVSNPVTKGLTAAALAATGAGIPLSAAIMGAEGAAGGALKPGGNLKGALTQGALGAGEGALASGAGSVYKKFAGSTLLDQIRGHGASASTSDAGGDDDTGNQTMEGSVSGNGQPSVWSKIGSGVKGAAQGAYNAATKNAQGGTDWGKIAKLGLAGASLYGQHQATNRANDYFNSQQNMRNGLMDMAKQDYAARAPLRNAAYSSLAKMAAAGPSGDIYRPYLAANG